MGEWDVVIQHKDKSVNLWWKIKIHQQGQMSEFILDWV